VRDPPQALPIGPASEVLVHQGDLSARGVEVVQPVAVLAESLDHGGAQAGRLRRRRGDAALSHRHAKAGGERRGVGRTALAQREGRFEVGAERALRKEVGVVVDGEHAVQLGGHRLPKRVAAPPGALRLRNSLLGHAPPSVRLWQLFH
jgi:hypothetical protein